jgi:hypothetical protein
VSEPDLHVVDVDQVMDEKIAALAQDYPAWEIRYVGSTLAGALGWWAMRHAPLTEAQRAAGLVPSIARGDVVSLVSELAVQDDIARQADVTHDGKVRP